MSGGHLSTPPGPPFPFEGTAFSARCPGLPDLSEALLPPSNYHERERGKKMGGENK